jgi:hypothetical protein
MVVAHLEGSLPASDFQKRAQEFISSEMRTFSFYTADSLDAPQFSNGRNTLHDILADPNSLYDPEETVSFEEDELS